MTYTHRLLDTVFVTNLRFVGFHGVYDVERREGRRFEVDARVTLNTHRAATSDHLADTVSYTTIADAIMAVAYGPSHHLIELLAEQMAQRVLALDSRLHEVEITLRKHAPDVAGTPDWVGIRIIRRRDDATDAAPKDPTGAA